MIATEPKPAFARPTSSGRRAFKRRGLTLVEMAVVVLLLGIALFLLAGLARTTRRQAKRQLAVRMLCALDEAMTLYIQHYKSPPPGDPDGSADRAVAALLNYDPSNVRLADLPSVLRRNQAMTEALVDPWGTPLRYVTADHASAMMRNRITANAGRPIFDSAGPDRRFGPAEGRSEGPDIWGEECLIEPHR